jgi:hypothetical protein
MTGLGADDPPFRSASFPKILSGLPFRSENDQFSSDSFQKLPEESYIYQSLTPGFSCWAAMTCRRPAPNQHIDIGLASIREPERKQTGTSSVAASRTYQEHDLELVSRNFSRVASKPAPTSSNPPHALPEL